MAFKAEAGRPPKSLRPAVGVLTERAEAERPQRYAAEYRPPERLAGRGGALRLGGPGPSVTETTTRHLTEVQDAARTAPITEDLEK
ncbi:MAG: hypothetical protein ACK4S4_09880 [Pyrinomonadaceae bacterium]